MRCPFLALSATVNNIAELKDWLQIAENAKSTKGARNVELITYDERWSELEIGLQRLAEPPSESLYDNDDNMFMRGRASSVASSYKDSEVAVENDLNEDVQPVLDPEPMPLLSTMPRFSLFLIHM
jgi:superfamily II RNA helicase